MQSTSSFFKQLIEDETYIENVSSLAGQRKQVHRLAISLLVACVHQQLQTDLGKGLVLRILEKHAQRIKVVSEGLAGTDDITALATEGNRLLGTLLPGKKSVIMSIIAHYAKLSFKDIDSIVGLSSYRLFTKLAVDSVIHNDEVTLLLPLNELDEFAPELSNKDYIAIGVYSSLSFLRSISTSAS